MSKREKILLEISMLLNLMLLTFVVILVVRDKPTEAVATTNENVVTAVAQVIPSHTPPVIEPTPTPLPSTATLEPTFTPTHMATATELPTATAVVPTATALASTATPIPPETPALTATVTLTPADTPILPPSPIPLPPQPWLNYLNDLRQIANLPLLVENADLTAGSLAHSLYMVKTDEVAHSEAEDNPFYTDIGARSGPNATIFTTVTTIADYEWAINYWFSLPFRALPLLDPHLQKVGYGDYAEQVGAVNMAATLDIYSAPRAAAPADIYPVFYPADGSHIWITRQSQFELPDPLSSCDFERPSGSPIIVQLGSGDVTPHVTNVMLQRGLDLLDICYFDETSYVNNIPSSQTLGRELLDVQDAIVIIPQAELAFGPAYIVTLEVNGLIYTWSFDVRARPVQ